MTRVAVRRLPIVVVLVALAIIAFVVGNADPDPAPAVRAPDDAAAAPEPDTRSSAWYCPGAPDSIPLETQTVTVANVGGIDTDVAITVYPADGSEPVAQTIPVPANTSSTLPRPTLGPLGPLSVVAFSSTVAVEAGVEGSGMLALGPCASTAAARWNFAAGTTVRGVQQWLVLFNPFGTDAKVDVALRTDERLDAPEALQSLDVPRRSRVLVPVHDYAVRRPRVAVEVRASTGLIVAEQMMLFLPESGLSGMTRSLGALEPAESWTFAAGTSITGSRTVIAIVNPDVVDTEVDVRVSAAEVPLTLSLPSDGVVWVQVGGCVDPPAPDCIPVAPDVTYSVTVDAGLGTPVVAEELVWFTETNVGAGAATVLGTAAPSDEFIVPRLGSAADRTATFSFVNAGATGAVTVDIDVIGAGTVTQPEALQDVEVPPGVSTLDLTPSVPADAAVVVRASGPIVMTRSLYSPTDLSRSHPVVVRSDA